ncbi:D-hexose-6-phosphate mutarotase [Hafnia psychrotolerans]|uniref:Putative glucose-6-phosphate 1-epimerase n=1 Tax=Hafnia psychrotolerans TaxID=1477018 RepID=A0ABQ1GSZ0_9GAMM|nr:D-hexose-6-phosphate mutarotase [Hafnia psychrotolerans]GGA49389.1 D-hexose-6-phosphate mutarotase [Hafnia psychrotolerans]
MTSKLFTLPVLKTITSVISQRQIDELPVLVIDHPKVRAAITLQGAHLLAYQPQNEQPILWMSSESAFKTGVAIRGGVPICWPWFGPAGQPSHGFARILPWELTSHQENEQGVELILTLKQNAETLELWPHDFTLTARFELGAECHIELESNGDFETTSALHAYFNIGDINNVKVSGLGKNYIDKVDGGKTAQQQGPLAFKGQTDRIYTAPEATSLIIDSALDRTLVIEHHFNSDVVAWNPGAELSASMKDMADDSYKTMVCVETASVSAPQKSNVSSPAKLAMTISQR